jgi:HK97 family phage major capsid protein
MTIDELIAHQRAKITAKLAERKTLETDLENLRKPCLDEKRDPTDDEATQIATATERKAAIDAEVAGYEAEVKRLQDEKAADERAAELAQETAETGVRTSGQTGSVRVGAEKRTYNPDTDKRGVQFVRDIAGQFANPASAERLARHMAEERVERGEYLARAAGTGAFAGLTVPQYLIDMYAPAAKSMRPFANICNHHDLPSDGMTLNISRITTSPTVALQASENAAVSETNIDDTLLTVSVQTAAGQQTLSRQAIDRSTGAEEVMLEDLVRSYHTTLDSTLINQATNGLSAVAQDTDYTDASPTAAELWPKILKAVSQCEAVLLGGGQATHVIMHSRRWAWMQSQVGSTWPFIAQPGIPTQAGGQVENTGYDTGVRGILPNGLKVVVDNNIATNFGTNEDEIYVVANNECHLWEDPGAPLMIRAEQPAAGSLGVLFVVYGYFAYTFARYTNAQQKISDTGLIAPTF